MNGEANRFGLIGESALDRLLNPPGTVGRKFPTLGRVKTFDRLHQADIAFADQVEQRQSKIFIIVRNFDDDAQIGFDHLLARFFVAFFNAGCEFDFLLRREEFDLADFAEVKFDRRFAVVRGAVFVADGQNRFFLARDGNGFRRGDGGGRRGSAVLDSSRGRFGGGLLRPLLIFLTRFFHARWV